MLYRLYLKRSIDIVISLMGLLLLAPLLYCVAILILIDSKGPVFFKHERVGKEFTPFRLIKFRTMRGGTDEVAGGFDAGDSSRVTRLGTLLRKGKVDEIPGLFNVLSGDMSIVGPRPEVMEYVQLHRQEFEKILTAKPGLTDYASIKYRNEEAILERKADPVSHYREMILPDKLRMANEYVRCITFLTDLSIVARTLRRVLGW